MSSVVDARRSNVACAAWRSVARRRGWLLAVCPVARLVLWPRCAAGLPGALRGSEIEPFGFYSRSTFLVVRRLHSESSNHEVDFYDCTSVDRQPPLREATPDREKRCERCGLDEQL